MLPSIPARDTGLNHKYIDMPALAIIPIHKAFIPEEKRKQITANILISRVASVYLFLRYLLMMITKLKKVQIPIVVSKNKESITTPC